MWEAFKTPDAYTHLIFSKYEVGPHVHIIHMCTYLHTYTHNIFKIPQMIQIVHQSISAIVTCSSL